MGRRMLSTKHIDSACRNARAPARMHSIMISGRLYLAASASAKLQRVCRPQLKHACTRNTAPSRTARIIQSISDCPGQPAVASNGTPSAMAFSLVRGNRLHRHLSTNCRVAWQMVRISFGQGAATSNSTSAGSASRGNGGSGDAAAILSDPLDPLDPPRRDATYWSPLRNRRPGSYPRRRGLLAPSPPYQPIAYWQQRLAAIFDCDPKLPDGYVARIVARLLERRTGAAPIVSPTERQSHEVSAALASLQAESEAAGYSAPYRYWHRRYMQVLYRLPGARPPPSSAMYRGLLTRLEVHWSVVRGRYYQSPHLLPPVAWIFWELLPEIRGWLVTPRGDAAAHRRNWSILCGQVQSRRHPPMSPPPTPPATHCPCPTTGHEPRCEFVRGLVEAAYGAEEAVARAEKQLRAAKDDAERTAGGLLATPGITSHSLSAPFRMADGTRVRAHTHTYTSRRAGYATMGTLLHTSGLLSAREREAVQADVTASGDHPLRKTDLESLLGIEGARRVWSHINAPRTKLVLTPQCSPPSPVVSPPAAKRQHATPPVEDEDETGGPLTAEELAELLAD